MIELKLDKRLFAPKFYPYLFDYSHRFEFYMGSAGSGKSYFITQKLIIRAINEPIRILVCRKYATTIRQTVFSLFCDVIKKWKLNDKVKINLSDFRITFLHNGSEIIFYRT
jgi:phage terminase large subunit